MTAPLAAVAAALAVLALWELLAVAETLAVARRLPRVLDPLVRARRAGRAPSTPERRRLALLSAAALLAGGWLMLGLLPAIALAAGGPSALGAAVRRRRGRYRAELARSAPGVARAVADALTAGHSISRALAEAAGGVGGAAAVELSAVAGAIALGEELGDALAPLCDRAGCRAYDTLVAAILLQRDAGGDLAALLRELARAQEAALRGVEDARAATAQARFTGLVVGILPAGAAGFAELASPGSLAAVLHVPIAAWLAAFAGLLQVLAVIAIRRLGRVELER